MTAWCATLTVGKGAPIETIAEAARLAKDGDTIDILPGEYHADVAVWLPKRLTIRGVGETPVLKADGRSAEGKAIWVLRNGEFVIENVAFERARRRPQRCRRSLRTWQPDATPLPVQRQRERCAHR